MANLVPELSSQEKVENGTKYSAFASALAIMSIIIVNRLFDANFSDVEIAGLTGGFGVIWNIVLVVANNKLHFF